MAYELTQPSGTVEIEETDDEIKLRIYFGPVSLAAVLTADSARQVAGKLISAADRY